MSIQYENLPDWAKKAIKQAGTKGTAQVNSGGNTLTVSQGVARFNGQKVVSGGAADEEDDAPLRLEDLPKWAQQKIIEGGGRSAVQIFTQGHSLQINGSRVTFDGRNVGGTQF